MIDDKSKFPLRTRIWIELTRKAIDGNWCASVPAVHLVSGASVGTCDTAIYELDTEAARIYSFRTRDPVTPLTKIGKKNVGALVIKRISDSAVEIRLECNASVVFEPQEFAFHFTVNGDITAAPVVFDPMIGSKGGPRV